MADVIDQKQSTWTKLSTLPIEKNALNAAWSHHTFSMCSYYVDVNDKEWIIILLPPQRNTNANICNSYLYDIKNDKFIPFIKNYAQDINKAFNILHVDAPQALETFSGLRNESMSYVIDNDNHILYWLHSQTKYLQTSLIGIDIKDLKNIKLIDQTIFSSNNKNNISFGNSEYTMLFTGNSIQFILGTSKGQELKHFQFNIKTKKLSLVHNNVHIQSVDHVVTQSQCLLDNLKIGDCVDTKYGNLVRTPWFLGQVLDIKDKKYYDNVNGKMDVEEQHRKCSVKSMSILVHYPKLLLNQCVKVSSEKDIYTSQQFDQFRRQLTRASYAFRRKLGNGDIMINKLKNASSVCDCVEQCDVYPTIIALSLQETFGKCHHIALPKTQSLYDKSLANFQGFYSKDNNAMIILGRNDTYVSPTSFGGVYCKQINDKTKQDCELIVNGFIRQFEDKMETDMKMKMKLTNINENFKINIDDRLDKRMDKKFFIPKDLREMICEYYFMTGDRDWQYFTKIDANGELNPSIDATISSRARFVIVDDHGDDDNNDDNCKPNQNNICVFSFGGIINRKHELISRIDINIQTNTYTKSDLANVKCPIVIGHGDTDCHVHVIFCKKSKMIHIFGPTFAEHYCIKLDVLNKGKTS